MICNICGFNFDVVYSSMQLKKICVKAQRIIEIFQIIFLDI